MLKLRSGPLLQWPLAERVLVGLGAALPFLEFEFESRRPIPRLASPIFSCTYAESCPCLPEHSWLTEMVKNKEEQSKGKSKGILAPSKGIRVLFVPFVAKL